MGTVTGLTSMASQITHVHLLSNGKVLLLLDNGATHILEANTAGVWSTRRVGDAPRTSTYTGQTMDNQGRVWIHGAEFGTNVGHTIIFDPTTESWTQILSTTAPAIANHTAATILDDGRHYASGSYLPANATSPAQAVSAPTFTTTESGLALLPDGRLVCMYANAGLSIDVIRPDYSADFVAAGSFDGNDTTQSISLASALAALPGDWLRAAGAGWTSAGHRIGYELGAMGWMHKIERVVLVGGSSHIWTFNPADNAIARAAFCGNLDATSEITQIGTVHASMNGLTRLQVQTNGNFVVSVPNATLGNSFIATWNAFDSNSRRFHVLTASGARNVPFRATGVTFNASLLQLTFTGVEAASPNNNITDTMATGAAVLWGRPDVNSMDAPGTFLPNGDLLFMGGYENVAVGTNFNNASRLMKWDGAAASAVVATNGAELAAGANDFQCRMTNLPDGSVLVTRGASWMRYVPDTAEATPITGTRPVITDIPNTIDPGTTVTMIGTTLNGVHEGGMYGDDASPRSNFPVAQLINIQTNHVHYCRTFGYTYRGIQPGRESACSIEVPASVPPGQYQLRAIAGGVPSLPVNVRIQADSAGDVIIIQ
jgi:hypothetical protein